MQSGLSHASRPATPRARRVALTLRVNRYICNSEAKPQATGLMMRYIENPPNPWNSTHVEWIGEPPEAAQEVFE